ncbi:MAG: DUF4920 domain-containing protein [Flavobacteriales bacterium]|nr:DUF4920 domain-containing protein [Flavobacteriales bacterium]
MKNRNIILVAMAFSALAFINSSCSKKTEEVAEFGVFGDTTVTAENAVDVSTLPQLLAGSDSIYCKLKGEISAVCQQKGCWMSMAISEDEKVHIKFKDYGFFVPMNAGGHQAIIDGVAYVDTVSVAQLKHRAQDAGKTEEEISAIDHPQVEYSFVANGVIIE